MIVWGGVDETFNVTNTGGRYDPGTDSWIPTTLFNAPARRSGETGVWTGSEMIVWSGGDTTGNFNTGGKYNAGTDSWSSTTTANAPLGRSSHTAVWTGSEMIVWGGSAASGVLNTGGRYCAQDSPTPTPTPSATPTATATATPSTTATPSVSPSAQPAQALNLSTRLHVLTDANVGIGGFIITGAEAKQVLLRGIGPSLFQFSVPNPLADPLLELHGPGGFTTIINDNWMDTQGAAIQATGLAPTDVLESAILATLSPGAYTGILRGKDNGVGVGLFEVYDIGQAAASKLGNISTRGFVGTDADIMIAGFILGGNNMGEDYLVVRGLGPSLAAFGIPNVLADPRLELRNSNGEVIRANNDWMDDPTQKALIISAGLAPSDMLESAIAATLMPGAYTALLSGMTNGTGVGLVEVYDHPTSAPTSTVTPTPTPGGSTTPSPTPSSTPTPTPVTCTENFDGVTAPALPNGWIASNPIPGDGCHMDDIDHDARERT